LQIRSGIELAQRPDGSTPWITLHHWSENAAHQPQSNTSVTSGCGCLSSDGTKGEVDLEGCLRGPVFEPLHDQSLFAKVCVDPELETIIWPNGADLAPEFVKELHHRQCKVSE
jgi:hypothetical protein